MARLEQFRTNGNRFRIGPWRGDPGTGYIMPLDDVSRIRDAAVAHTVDELARRGYERIVTSALTGPEGAVFERGGFATAQELHLLAHSLEPIPRHPSEDVRLRRAWRKDRRAMLAIDRLAFDEFWRFDESSLAESIIATPRVRVRVDRGSPLAAYAVTGFGADTAYLQRLAVHPDAQSRGIGSSLVIDALRWARRRGSRRCFVNTQLQNQRALDLYLRLGFVPETDRLSVLQRDLRQ